MKQSMGSWDRVWEEGPDAFCSGCISSVLVRLTGCLVFWVYFECVSKADWAVMLH